MAVWNDGDLDEYQVAAIREEGNVFLVACPGSGKTRTLTYKIAERLVKIESEKKRVIAITYTHRAAEEILDRIDYLGIDTSKLWVGTIHSFCLEWILKPYAIYHDKLKHGFRIVNSHDSERMLTNICRKFSQPNITYWDCGHYYAPAGLLLTSNSAFKQASVHEAIQEYHEALHSERQIDFELILQYAYELVSKNPSISLVLSSIFSCILVDEYQDTKEIQYAIIASILKAGTGAVSAFIVGDPNQAIYESLGGYAISLDELRAITELEFTELELSLNYRSSDRIVKYFKEYNVTE